MKRRRIMVLGSAIVVALLATAPLIGPRLGIDITVISEVLLDALAAMSVNLLLGYTGLPAFGNAAFFGLGAYGAALSIKYLDVGFVSAIVIGTATAFVGALLIGPFLLRRRGIYFGLLAIAFGQVFYFVAYRFTNFTGGEDGMSVTRPEFALFGRPHTVDATAFYYLCFAVFVAVLAAFWVMAVSPFGQTLMAIRQNETRVRYLGLSSDRFIFVALIIAAAVAGLGGSLYAMLINFAYPLLLDWHESGNFVLMTLLGGAGTVWGPLLGAVIYVVGKDVLSTITQAWQLIIGGIFVVCVLGFPRGILGSLSTLTQRKDFGDDSLAEANAAFDPNSPVVEGRNVG